MFILQQSHYGKNITTVFGLNGYNVQSAAGDKVTAKFDLTLSTFSVVETIEEEKRRNMFVYATIEYNTNIFDKSSIFRMIEHLFSISKIITTHDIATMKDQLISNINSLNKEQQQQMLVEWNDTEYQWWPSMEEIEKDISIFNSARFTIHELFEDQVKKTSDSIGVVFEDEQITYGQLDKRSNQLAQYLISMEIDSRTDSGNLFGEVNRNDCFSFLCFESRGSLCSN